jgi:hypothetical protein
MHSSRLPSFARNDKVDQEVIKGNKKGVAGAIPFHQSTTGTAIHLTCCYKVGKV